MSDEMVTWLQAQVDEDEQAALDLDHAGWTAEGDSITAPPLAGRPAIRRIIAEGLPYVLAEHIVRHDPARVLREVEAKRRIMDRHRDDGYGACLGCGFGNNEERMVENIDECPVLRALALPYADRPGYREEWRP